MLKNERTQINQYHMLHFDLEATYTVCYISRLLGLSKRRALKYVKANGKLTDKGIQMLHDLNEQLSQDFDV